MILKLTCLSKGMSNLLDTRRVVFHMDLFPEAQKRFYRQYCQMDKHELKLRKQFNIPSDQDLYKCLRHRLDTEPNKHLDDKNLDQIHCDLHRTNTTKATYTEEG